MFENTIEYKDSKTLLYGHELDILDKVEDDVRVYLFIQKYKEGSSWNLVAPVIQEIGSEKVYQFGIGWFALEGGGGVANTGKLIAKMKKLQAAGKKVHFIPLVAANHIMKAFQYVDSGIKICDLLNDKDTVDLINYNKNEFKWILKKYNELMSN